MTERVRFAIPRRQRTLQRNCSFGNDDNWRIVARKSMFDERTHFIDVEGALGNKYGVCTPGDSRVPCDPTRVASHDLDNEYTVVTLSRRVQSINGVSCNRHGGIKTERVVGGSQVVVDGLWYPHDRKANRCELGCHTERVLTSDDNKTFHTQAIYCVKNPAFTVVISVRIGSARPQDRASPWENPTDGGDIKRHRIPFQGSSPSVTKSDELVTVDLDALAYDSSDNCVQTRAVAAASQHSYAHGGSVPRTRVCPEVGRRVPARRKACSQEGLGRKTGFEPATIRRWFSSVSVWRVA